MLIPLSFVLIPLLMQGLNMSTEDIIYVNSQSEYLIPGYYCWDFAKDLATELNITGVEAYPIFGFFRNGGHYWTVAHINGSWTEIEPQNGMDVTFNDNYEFSGIFVDYKKKKEIINALLTRKEIHRGGLHE